MKGRIIAAMDDPTTDVIQGTLDMLILKTLSLEPMHGFGIARRIEQVSRGVFKVNPGSLLTAFQRLERDGLLDAEWRQTDKARRAKYYTLSRAGRKRLQADRQTGCAAPRAAVAGRGLAVSLWRQLTLGPRGLMHRTRRSGSPTGRSLLRTDGRALIADGVPPDESVAPCGTGTQHGRGVTEQARAAAGQIWDSAPPIRRNAVTNYEAPAAVVVILTLALGIQRATAIFGNRPVISSHCPTRRRRASR